MQVRLMLSCGVCVCVTFVHSVKTDKYIFQIFSLSGSHTILVFPDQTAWQYSDGNLPNGGVEAGGVGRNLDSEPISGFIACCEPFQRQMQIHIAAIDHGEFITLVAAKRWSLLMAGNNDEVYDKKPQCYAEDILTQ